MSAFRQPTDLLSSAIDLGRREAWHPSRNVGFVDQGYDWKTTGTTPKYYGGSTARGPAADFRAAEVLTDYEAEAKARKADLEFSGFGYVRNGPGPR